MTVAEREKSEKIRNLKFTILGRHVVTYVRICVFEAQKFVHLRAILADFPDTKHQELPGTFPDCTMRSTVTMVANSAPNDSSNGFLLWAAFPTPP